jgi:hypothetical protein
MPNTIFVFGLDWSLHPSAFFLPLQTVSKAVAASLPQQWIERLMA